jgi:hypothetical protein
MKTKLGGELIVRDAGIELFGPRIASMSFFRADLLCIRNWLLLAQKQRAFLGLPETDSEGCSLSTLDLFGLLV